uniref:Uncharacterized protein n=1 Tax=viral metagenome TaxID=1070528 RepID=A0A6C0IBH7_9ZZZZ
MEPIIAIVLGCIFLTIFIHIVEVWWGLPRY